MRWNIDWKGKVVPLLKNDINVGDIIYLKIGMQIPADGIVLEESELKIWRKRDEMRARSYPYQYIWKGYVYLILSFCLSKFFYKNGM